MSHSVKWSNDVIKRAKKPFSTRAFGIHITCAIVSHSGVVNIGLYHKLDTTKIFLSISGNRIYLTFLAKFYTSNPHVQHIRYCDAKRVWIFTLYLRKSRKRKRITAAATTITNHQVPEGPSYNVVLMCTTLTAILKRMCYLYGANQHLSCTPGNFNGKSS